MRVEVLGEIIKTRNSRVMAFPSHSLCGFIEFLDLILSHEKRDNPVET